MTAVSPGRRAGYRLFGRGFDYLLHLRPLKWPIMAAHTALGYLIAVGLSGVGRGRSLGAAGLGLFAWVACLNGGTLAVNSAFDRDEGDIAYLRNPPRPPAHLFAFGLAVMLLGQLLAFRLPPAFTAAYAVCFAASLAYSVPPVRLKAVAGADWAINMVGFGSLTPFAGWAATGRPIEGAAVWLFAAFCPLFAALYPLTQLYQLEEDRRRGDLTLALRLGAARSLDCALAGIVLAFVLFGIAAWRSGWATAPGASWRAGTLAGALAGWLAVVGPWRLAWRRLSPAQQQRRMYWALGAWAVTDLAVVAAWAT